MDRASQNVNEVHRGRLSRLDKTALWVTKRIGTMGFFIMVLTWTAMWLGWNIFGPEELRFDPFPAFVLWIFVSNLIQLHLLPLIMVSQNIQSRHAELRVEHDYEVSKRAEKGIGEILVRLDQQEKLIKEILEKLNK